MRCGVLQAFLLAVVFLIPKVTCSVTTFYSIGIFSSCLQNANRTEFNTLASSMDELYEEFVAKAVLSKMLTVKLEYDSYDVCKSFEILYQVIERIALDQRYALKLPFNNSGYTENSIFAIFTFLPEGMTRLLKITFFDLPMFDINFELASEGQVKAAGTSDAIRFANDLVRVAESYKWESLYFISIKNHTYNHNTMYKDYFEKSINAFENLKTCFQYVTVDMASKTNTIDDIFKVAWLQNRKSAVVLFGEERHQAEILRKFNPYFNQRQLPVVIHNLIKWKYYQLWHAQDIPFVAIVDYKFFNLQVAPSIHFDYSSGVGFASLPNFLKREVTSVLPPILNYISYMGRLPGPVNDSGFLYFLEMRKNAKEHNTRQKNLILDGNVFPNATSCPNIICKPGQHRAYGNITSGFSWKCVPCPRNHIKRIFGDSRCIPCTGVLSIDNGIRTRCVDPYTEFYEQLFNQEYVAILVLSVTGVLFTLFSILVFVSNRHTPIVKTSDFILSIIHMATTFLIFIVTPLPFLKKASSTFVCTWRTFNISFLYIINVSIQFIKSQKLLNACLSKTRLTSESTSRTNIIQAFTVFILIVSVNISLVAALLHTPPGVSSQIDHQNMLRMHFCNTVWHSNMVIGMAVFIQFMGFVQAFRGRHVPSVMNDAVILTFTTLILTLVFIVSYGIEHFRQPIDKDVFQLGAVIINTFIISLSMYGQKAVRMLLYPEKNTRSYFQSKTFRSFRSYNR